MNRSKLYGWRYYIVCNLVPYRPFIIPLDFSSEYQAEYYMKRNELRPKYFEVLNGKAAINYGLKVRWEWWRVKPKVSSKKTTWTYPKWCKTKSQKQDFRTNSRRRLRKQAPHLFQDYGKNRWWFFTAKKDQYENRKANR